MQSLKYLLYGALKLANPYSIRQDFAYKWINAQSPNETFSIINFYFKALM